MKKINIYKKDIFSIDEINTLSWSPLTHDWFGQVARNKFCFKLAVDKSNLYFQVMSDSKPWYFTEYSPQTYQPELWKRDVAELFLKDKSSNSYQEFNLAPNACWWTQVFESYRSVSNKNFLASPPIQAESNLDGSWQALMTIPHCQVFKNLDQLLGNITFVQGDPQKFYSWGKSQKSKPDFHDPVLMNDFVFKDIII